MQSLETLNGQLQLTLRYRQSAGQCRVQKVVIHSSRLRLSSRFFTGKPLATVPAMVGLLFSLCGTAQSVVSARACEQALGQPADRETEKQRDFQVQIETLVEHLLRLSQEWSAVLDSGLPVATDLQALFRIKRELMQKPDPVMLDALQQWLENNLLGLPIAHWLDFCQQGDGKALALHGRLGKLITRIRANRWENLGSTELYPLPALDTVWWLAKLASPDAGHFCAEPDVDGQACETSALTRQWDNPALQVWRKQGGSGLLTRLIARVLDMLDCWRALAKDKPLCFTLPGEAMRVFPQGIACVQTARGLLVHRVVQQDGLIRDYQIVAPTEWNFHPHGSLYQMLHGLGASDETGLRAKAQALVTALDPCVAYQLEIIPDA